jgi:crotonobetainyl-CoA:carnitine CoA-transferase CaiB-like acyl-CoA transferase
VEGLAHIRVIDFTTGIAGPYATKLLADLGADVIKVESATGDPMRRWSASGSAPADGDAALFSFLNTCKRSVTVGDSVPSIDDPEIASLVAGADVVVEEGMLDVDALRARHSLLCVVSVTPYGLTGPLAGRPWTEFTVQAEAGSILFRGQSDMPPYQAGGRISEWTTGCFAAPAVVAAVLSARRNGVGVHVDCSMLETMAIAGSVFADVMNSLLGRPSLDGTISRTPETPSIEPAADGWVGFNTNTGAMFQNFLLMIERPDLLEDEELAGLVGRMNRLAEWTEIVHAWTKQHSVREIISRAAELRIPCAQVHSGQTVLDDEHLSARGVFIENPAGFRQPRPPSRVEGRAARALSPAPSIGSDNGSIEARPEPARNGSAAGAAEPAQLPFEGIRILDLTSWWAGPSGTHLLATLGAEVIHVESTGHPDGMRLTGFAFGQPDWWEWGHMFLAANTNKFGLTLDVAQQRGRELALELIDGCDAVVENFSPRVVEQWNLGWDVVHARNPRAVMMRMPAFGLSGPWRDRVGFAQTMEQMSGMAFVTGFPDDQPRILRGPCDPIAGMHGAVALMMALDDAQRSGEGVLVESTMVEAALSCAAEQVVEFTAYGALLERDGNRSPYAAPQGLYACQGWECWLALSIATDEQWRSLVKILGDPDWAHDEALATHAGRRAAHDELDEQLGAWAAEQDLDAIVSVLLEHGIPAARAWDPRIQSRHPQLVARGLYEECDHPVVGRHPVPGLPYRWSGVDHWVNSPAPTLGQHSRQVLGEFLGLSETDLDALEDDGIIGTRPKGL